MVYIYLLAERGGCLPKLTKEPLPEGCRNGMAVVLVRAFEDVRFPEALRLWEELLATVTDQVDV